ncbi:MAG TPA: hypothetical protein PKE29_06585 [Phycisphaerales bacterium]|nr:hypothetical protein [Phycisphaerales bacterium]
MNRRDVLKAGALAGDLGLTLGSGRIARRPMAGEPPPTPAPPPARGRVLRVAQCLHHLRSLADKPELVLTGGDLIMDSFAQDAARTRTL